jgi:hypothetical protein
VQAPECDQQKDDGPYPEQQENGFQHDESSSVRAEGIPEETRMIAARGAHLPHPRRALVPAHSELPVIDKTAPLKSLDSYKIKSPRFTLLHPWEIYGWVAA